MSAILDAPPAERRTLPPLSGHKAAVTLLLVAMVAVAAWAYAETAPDPAQIARGVDYAGDFLARTVPFVWPTWGEVLWYSTLTLAIVICGTVLAAVLSLPVAYLAARNTSPLATTRWLGRTLSVVSRAAPDAFMAAIFALVFGQGALAGILALGLHSVGMISKLTADAIEQIDEGPRTALRATGATRSQEFWAGIWPQIMPAFIATTLHRMDINLRVSVILGFVGVAGLGYELSHHLQTLNYREAMPYAIIIFVLCVVFEMVSSAVRKVLLGVEGAGPRRTRGAAAGPSGSGTAPEVSRRRPWDRTRVTNSAFAWGALLIVVASVAVSATQGSSFVNFWQNAAIAWHRLWPPMLAPEKWLPLLEALLVTMQIALAATLFALVFSAIIGSFAARNVAPNGTVRSIFRGLLVVIRGIPELLLAFFLIILTGLGSSAAMLALGIGGIGLLGKLLADSMEEVNPGPERALRATGATRLQIFGAATLPLSAPAWVGHTLYLLDSNFRAATILGVVGAPGIGFMLMQASRINHHEMLMMLICVFVVVLLLELLSSWIRKHVK